MRLIKLKMILKNPSRILHSLAIFAAIVLGFIAYHIIQDAYYKMYANNLISINDYDAEISAGGFINLHYADTMFMGEKLVHFDLKGAPPKVSYILKLFPLLKKLGATGLLMEYEDMFPYTGDLKEIVAANAYSPTDIAQILNEAEKYNFTVIPLVQTFGHLEFVLKLQKFRPYREMDSIPDVICPTYKPTYPLLQKMIDQVMTAHPNARYFHIGCDEVYTVGLCKDCQRLMKSNKWGKKHLYFGHVKKIAQYIIKTYPKVRPIIWGDEIMKKHENVILQHKIPELVDVMLWNYKTTMTSFPSDEDMLSYATLFKNIWIASAFKGARNLNQMVTYPKYHVQNNRGWMHVVMKWKGQIHFKGIVLTGWQRFNHFAVLCELFPVAVPSLAMCLHFLKNLNSFQTGPLTAILGCNGRFPENSFEMRTPVISRLDCQFPGFRAYSAILLFSEALKELQITTSFLKNPSFAFYSTITNYTNPRQVQGHYNTLQEDYERMMKLKAELRTSLSEVYDEHTVTEWILTHFVPHQLMLQSAIKLVESMMSKTTWPTRPLLASETHLQKVFRNICNDKEMIGCSMLHYQSYNP